MSPDDGMQATESVEQAINRILDAEREARAAVERCRAEAARILAAGQQDARRVADRTEQRVELARRIAEREVERVQAQLEAVQSRARFRPPETDAAGLLERAVDVLADEIIDARP